MTGQQDHKPWCASLSTLTAKPRPCDCVRVPLPTTPGSAARSADSADSFCKPSADLEKAARMALEALEVATTPLAKDRQEVLRAQAALRQALRNSVEQPAQQQKEGFASPGGGYVPAIPRPMPLDWKLVPRKATPEMLKAMDECAQEGYDERLYAGMASSVYMAAWDASPVMGTLPEQPAQQQEPVAIDRLYIEALIEGLYQNEDPVSIDAAEEFERLLKTPASPPASKPWVELTDQEIENLWNKYESRFDYYLFSCAIEAKLKEKNA